MGGDCNAFTTKEYTAFYVRLLAEHLPLGLDILSEIMRDPALRPTTSTAERTVILDEILMHADEPADLAGERWQAALFPAHPLGRDTLGTAVERARRSTADDIRAFFEHHYRPGNMVVSVAGDCRHDEVADGDRAPLLRAAAAASAPPGAGPGYRGPSPWPWSAGPTEQAHLVLGRPLGLAIRRAAAGRCAVLNHVLGGGLSSRLFQKVREQRGLAYSIWSERAAYQDTGSLAVVAGTAPEHVDEVLRIVTGELELLAEHGITERELAVAKGNLRADTLLACEDSGARMSRLGLGPAAPRRGADGRRGAGPDRGGGARATCCRRRAGLAARPAGPGGRRPLRPDALRRGRPRAGRTRRLAGLTAARGVVRGTRRRPGPAVGAPCAGAAPTAGTAGRPGAGAVPLVVFVVPGPGRATRPSPGTT